MVSQILGPWLVPKSYDASFFLSFFFFLFRGRHDHLEPQTALAPRRAEGEVEEARPTNGPTPQGHARWRAEELVFRTQGISRSTIQNTAQKYISQQTECMEAHANAFRTADLWLSGPTVLYFTKRRRPFCFWFSWGCPGSTMMRSKQLAVPRRRSRNGAAQLATQQTARRH